MDKPNFFKRNTNTGHSTQIITNLQHQKGSELLIINQRCTGRQKKMSCRWEDALEGEEGVLDKESKMCLKGQAGTEEG